jgi:hypothetical protein
LRALPDELVNVRAVITPWATVTMTGAAGLTSALPQVGVDVTDAGRGVLEVVDLEGEVMGAATTSGGDAFTVAVADGLGDSSALDSGVAPAASGDAELTVVAAAGDAAAGGAGLIVAGVPGPLAAVHADTARPTVAAMADTCSHRIGEARLAPAGRRVLPVAFTAIRCMFAVSLDGAFA